MKLLRGALLVLALSFLFFLVAGASFGEWGLTLGLVVAPCVVAGFLFYAAYRTQQPDPYTGPTAIIVAMLLLVLGYIAEYIQHLN